MSKVESARGQEFLDTREAASFLNVSPRTLPGWRSNGGGPRFVKLGRVVRYRLADLLDFAEQGERSSTADQGEHLRSGAKRVPTMGAPSAGRGIS